MTRVTQTHVPSSETPSPEADRTEVSTDLPPLCQEGHILAGRYRIERFLDRGGMGEVYAASDLLVEERVAVKIMREPGTADSQFIERFRREVQLARRVTHPNVCRIFDMGMDGPLAFLSMELLAGETLARRIARAPLGIEEARPLVDQMASALQAVHAAGVIHRDFKTANVFLVPAEGGVRAVVADFGVARRDSRQATLLTNVTHTGIVLGTPAFMAPEQVEGKLLSPAIDVYALGVVIYNMLTGRYPFDGESAFSVAARRLREAPSSPRTHLPDVDPTWEAVIMRCLERDPRHRFRDVSQVAEALRGRPSTLSTDDPTRALPTLELRPPKRVRRWLVPAAAGALAAVALAVGIAVSGASDEPPRPRVPAAATVPLEVRSLVHAPPPAEPTTPAVPIPAEPPSVPAAASPEEAPAVPVADPVIIPDVDRQRPSRPVRKKRPKPAAAAPAAPSPADDDAPLPVP